MSDRLTIRFSPELLAGIKEQSATLGLPPSELIRLAVVSFLKHESALDAFLEHVSRLESEVTLLNEKQTQFCSVAVKALMADRDQETVKKILSRLEEISKLGG